MERATYHHGNLRTALLEAGVALASESGPGAVVLREATRRAGVSPNAAYRHFSDRAALLAAVRGRAMAALARAMEARLGSAVGGRARLEATGRAYVEFALAEPGLFRTAFSGAGSELLDAVGDSGLTPYELLARCLDDLVAEGSIPAARRPEAEVAAWSAVHGLATLLLDGPLQTLSAAERETAVDKVIAVVHAGL